MLRSCSVPLISTTPAPGMEQRPLHHRRCSAICGKGVCQSFASHSPVRRDRDFRKGWHVCVKDIIRAAMLHATKTRMRRWLLVLGQCANTHHLGTPRGATRLRTMTALLCTTRRSSSGLCFADALAAGVALEHRPCPGRQGGSPPKTPGENADLVGVQANQVHDQLREAPEMGGMG